MINLTIKPHWAKEKLSSFPATICARTLNISPNYFRAVMNGHYDPSTQLETRIQNLVDELRRDNAEAAA